MQPDRYDQTADMLYGNDQTDDGSNRRDRLGKSPIGLTTDTIRISHLSLSMIAVCWRIVWIA